MGEPIDRENPPAHFLYPPGSESDVSKTFLCEVLLLL